MPIDASDMVDLLVGRVVSARRDEGSRADRGVPALPWGIQAHHVLHLLNRVASHRPHTLGPFPEHRANKITPAHLRSPDALLNRLERRRYASASFALSRSHTQPSEMRAYFSVGRLREGPGKS